MIPRFIARAWGGAHGALARTRRWSPVDLLVLAGLVGLVFAAHRIANEWTGQLRPTVDIDLSLRALPRYTLFSLARGLIAYGFSLAFTLVYGYWAAKDRVAERLLIPLLDILQSIPVLGFMPGLVLTLVAAFPSTNLGLELAAVLMIFTGQVWNMTFSYFHSLRSVPHDLDEAATVYRYSPWQRLRWVELPHATMGLVWNSMMSMAGGWFFLMISEAFVLGNRDFRLPGIGAYMSVAVARGDGKAMLQAVVAMIVMIVLLDQLLWRPVVVWSQKFRVEESAGSEVASSWFLTWLRRSRVLAWVGGRLRTPRDGLGRGPRPAPEPATAAARAPASKTVAKIAFALLLVGLAIGAWRLAWLLRPVAIGEWAGMIAGALLTLARVLAATVIGTLWTLPAGLAIGLSPRLSRVLQPVTQIAASFPAPMLFPLVIAALHASGVPLGAGSVLLMLLGTQWYILFNVIAGTMAIPADLREATATYRLSRFERFRRLYAPAVFPYLVTGWVTAAGGAWNASIVSEYVSFHGRTIAATGIGSRISLAAEHGDLAHLAAGVLVMSALVVLFNRTLWRRLYFVAEQRFALAR
ncbi:MAG: ABC transporter permease subunit [Candidatus Eisenbacteria bacterium]|nr:ABC transporter permease subunit [Candidatus Eisenbacteria bacterium]